jgi:hypothetical protein
MAEVPEERRTFMELRPMGELTPIDPTDLSDREVSMAAVRGVYQVHECLERHILEQRERDIAANEKRIQLAEDLVLAKGVALDTRSEVRDVALALGVRKPDLGEAKPKSHAVATWGKGKLAAAIAGIASTLVALVAGAAAVWGALHSNFPGAVPSPPIVAVETVEAPK